MKSAKRLLIVDDDDTYREVLARSLTRRGFTVDGAANPGAALEVFRAVRPDFVLLDLNLDGQSGLNFIAPLRVLSSDVRIVVLTGYASIQTAVSALRLGAVHYLPKPANVADIVNALLEDEPTVEPLETTTRMSVRGMEWEYIQRTLAEHGNNIAATARALNMHRRTLQRKLAKRRPPESL